MRTFSLLFVFILFVGSALAQAVQGHVVDVEGHALPGVSIWAQEWNTGTTTDAQGNFTLQGHSRGNCKLVFSFVGFQTVQRVLVLRSGTEHLDIVMRPAENLLGEVRVMEQVQSKQKAHASLLIETVDKNFIRDNAGNSLMQTLGKLPGVNSIDIGAGMAKPVLRGLGFNRVAVIDNGIGQAGQEWGADHGLEIDQYTVEELEIVKGPASLLYGSEAIGGVIVISPPKVPTESVLETNIGMGYRTNNQWWGLSAYSGLRRANFFYKLRLSGSSYADYRVPADAFFYNNWWLPIYDQRLKNTAGGDQNASLVLGWLGAWGRNTLTVSQVFQRMGFFPGSHGIPSRKSMEPDSADRDIDLPYQQVRHVKVLENLQILGQYGSWHLDLGYQINHRKEFSQPHTHGYERMPDNPLELEFELHTLSGKLKRSSTHIHQAAKIEYGVVAEHRDNRIGGYSFLLPSYRRSMMGAFGYVNYHLSEHIVVNGGARYDFARLTIDGYEDRYVANLFPLDADKQIRYRYRSRPLERRFGDYSFGAGLAYNPHPAWSMKWNFGKSFRVPNANELSANGIHHGSFRFERGDSSLRSEVSYQMDWALAWHTARWKASVSPYVNYFTNFIYLQPSGSFADLPHAGQVYQFMQAPALRWGGELSVEWQPTKQLLLNADAEYIYAFNLDTRYFLPMTPPLNLGLGWSYTFGNWGPLVAPKLSADWKWVAAQNQTTTNEEATPAYQLWNLRLGAAIRLGRLHPTVSLQVRNLLDTKYLNHLSYYRLIQLPEPGRNVVVNLEIPLNYEL